MLYWISSFSRCSLSVLNIFRYLTVRTGENDRDGADLRVLARAAHHRPPARQARQGPADPRRRPQSHLLTKKGTPTMGELMILSGVLVGILLWGNLTSACIVGRAQRDHGFGLVASTTAIAKVTRQTHGFAGQARAWSRR